MIILIFLKLKLSRISLEQKAELFVERRLLKYNKIEIVNYKCNEYKQCFCTEGTSSIFPFMDILLYRYDFTFAMYLLCIEVKTLSEQKLPAL